jgi:hypothetical protein
MRRSSLYDLQVDVDERPSIADGDRRQLFLPVSEPRVNATDGDRAGAGEDATMLVSGASSRRRIRR